MANAVLKTMDFEESAALEAITYSCMFTPCSYKKFIHIFIHTFIHAKLQCGSLMLYSVRTYMQLLTYVQSCIFTLHVCDRMAAASIQAALGMKTTQLNLHPPQDPAATVYEYHTEQIYLTHLPNNFCFALLFIVVVEYILLNFKLQLTANLSSFVSFSSANGK